MFEKPTLKPIKNESKFSGHIASKTDLKKEARDNPSSVWFGLGLMGLVGWSVVIPTLLGTALGFWLDQHSTGARSWTLTFLVAGLALGCLNAWHWVDKENKAIHHKKNKKTKD